MPRLVTEIDAANAGKLVTPSYIAPHAERFTVDVCSSPVKLAASLTRFLAKFVQLQRIVGADSQVQLQRFRNCTIPATGTFQVQHNLGRMASWRVSRWRNASAAPSLIESTLSTTNILVLTCGAAGLADLEVY